MLLLPLACSEGRQEDTAPQPLDDDAITVGSFDFDESMLVAEIIERWGSHPAPGERRRATEQRCDLAHPETSRPDVSRHEPEG